MGDDAKATGWWAAGCKAVDIVAWPCYRVLGCWFGRQVGAVSGSCEGQGGCNLTAVQRGKASLTAQTWEPAEQGVEAMGRSAAMQLSGHGRSKGAGKERAKKENTASEIRCGSQGT